MNAVFSRLAGDVKSPVRASGLRKNWLSVSFFKQTLTENSFRKLLAVK
ncbi:hypothetical protein [Anaeroselena agilis]|uniref:Transposase n=1 Tax=Anaeroselena agilis TaxID=3063788 RepID=A0ABU3P1K9_9FIRM|nr:hypothetical protein [Selenomonadales bacterium 4137-cl]